MKATTVFACFMLVSASASTSRRRTWSKQGSGQSSYRPDYYSGHSNRYYKQDCLEGTIQAFYGKKDQIPDGYIVCDGSKGTPNLQDRFLVGAGKEFAFGDKGGASAIVLEPEQVPAHSHGVGTIAVADNGEHRHTIDALTDEGGHFHNKIDLTIKEAGAHLHDIDLKTDKAGEHIHKFNAFVPEDYGTYHPDFDVPLQKIDTDKSYPIEVSPEGGHRHVLKGSTTENGVHTHVLEGTIGAADDGEHVHRVIGNTDKKGVHSHGLSGETAAVGEDAPVPILPPFRTIYWICCPFKDEPPKEDWHKH